MPKSEQNLNTTSSHQQLRQTSLLELLEQKTEKASLAAAVEGARIKLSKNTDVKRKSQLGQFLT
jgi:hypothetical protein